MVNCYIHFYHLDKTFNIPVTPDQIQNTVSVEFSQEKILGSSAPQVTFGSSGPRSQNVSITLHRQMFALENPSLAASADDDEDSVDNLINALAAAAYPKYMDARKAIIPPSILIRFGEESCIRGVIEGSIQQTSSGAWLKNGKMSVVSINFNVLEVEPFSADYVYQNGYLRSVSTDLARSSIWHY